MIKDTPESGFTVRAFLIGLAAVIGIAAIVPLNIIYVGTSELATRAFPMGAGVALLLSIFVGNILLRKIVPAIALKAREILVIYIMVLIACVFPGIGLMMYIGTIAGPAEYGTPTNKYFETLFNGVDRIAIRDGAEVRRLTRDELSELRDAFNPGAPADAFSRSYVRIQEGADPEPLDPRQFGSYPALLAGLTHAPWDKIVPFDTVEARSIEGPTDELNYMFNGFPHRYNGPGVADIFVRVWLKPLMWWTVFLLTLCIMVFCTMTILRKQWVEKERLLFPLTRVPIELVESLDEPAGASVPLYRNRLLWIGAAIPIIFMTWRFVAFHTSLIPNLPSSTHSEWGIAGGLALPQNVASTALSIVFPVIGFTFLINLDVSFSLWFFHLLGVFETGYFNWIQFGTAAGSDQYSSGHSYVNHQAMGGVIALVLVGLYIARGHLRDVVRKALGRPGTGLDDADEPVSYRFAAIGLAVSALFCTWWLVFAGMSLWAAALFLGLSLILYIGATRVICEGGIIFVQACMIPQTFMLRSFGAQALGHANLVILSLSFMWMADFTSVFMPNIANSMKMADMVGGKRKKWLFPAALIVVVLIFAVTGFQIFRISYNLSSRAGDWQWYFGGGGNHVGWAMDYAVAPLDELNKFDQREKGRQAWYADKAARWPFDNYRYTDETKLTLSRNDKAQYYNDITVQQDRRYAIQPTRWLFTALGFGFMAFLMLMRNRFVWWPLHPIGFPFANAPSIQRIWFSVFLGWLIKLLIIKYGGVKLFNKIKPVFIGIIIGAVISVGFYYALDMILFVTDVVDKGCGLSG